jgi:hypothetical protein
LGKLFAATLLLLTSTSSAFAQGDLLISPLRVIFEGSKKSQEISLANVGKDTATYSVSIVDIRMKDDGSFETITTPDTGQRFAGPYMRFFPRKVTLAPNESQVVKIQLMKTSSMEPGEYRSHLYFRAVPDEKPLGENSKKDSAKISIQLKPIFGITTPVIIRVGENDADVSLSDASLTTGENKKHIVGLTFNRSGNMSVYGDLAIQYVSADGKTTLLKNVKGIGVYTPNKLRRFRVELDDDKPFDHKKGKIRIVYTLQTNDKTPTVKETEIALK